MPGTAFTENALQLFCQVRVGAPQVCTGLVVLPLFGNEDGPDADLIDETIPTGKTTVSEVNEQGQVNLLTVEHRGNRPLLLVDGESVQGARQDRVFNSSIVLLPGRTAQIPVSCVERGRWQYQAPSSGARDLDRTFRASSITLPGLSRSSKLQRLTRTTLIGGAYDADQNAVWRDVDEHLERTHTISQTRAYSDAYKQHRSSIEAQLRQLAPCPGQTGIAAYRGRKLVTLDLFGSASLYVRAWHKIARGIFADRCSNEEANDDPSGDCLDVLGLVARASEWSMRRLDGCGPTLHGLVTGHVFSAATSDDRVFHAIIAGT